MKKQYRVPRPVLRLFPLLMLTAVLSCEKPVEFSMRVSDPATRSDHREFITSGRFNRVVILYAEGHNTLSEDIRGDIGELCSGYVPQDPSEALLVFSKLPLGKGRYSDPIEPVLFRVRQRSDGQVYRDTLLKFPPRTPAASAETMSEVMSYVHSHFPSDHYGMILSSHGSGWLPAGYMTGSESYEGSDFSPWSFRQRRAGDPVPDAWFSYYDNMWPRVRSYGGERIITNGSGVVYEMTAREVAASIPMHLDFMQFDACYMGCVEVAYDLRNVTDLIGFSPAEELAAGLDYTRLSAHLFTDGAPDIVGVCKDYFDYYNKQPDGTFRSATISLVDCTKIEPLAAECRKLFAAYRQQIMALDPDTVQRYYRSGKYYFFDLQDILLKAGITDAEKQSLQRALDDCVVYKAATPSFMGEFKIETYSGLGMYLPSIATYHPKKNFTFLNNFYRTGLDWNDATGLVQ